MREDHTNVIESEQSKHHDRHIQLCYVSSSLFPITSAAMDLDESCTYILAGLTCVLALVNLRTLPRLYYPFRFLLVSDALFHLTHALCHCLYLFFFVFATRCLTAALTTLGW